MASRWCGKHALDDAHGSAAIWADTLGVVDAFACRGGRQGGGLRFGFFVDEQSAARCDLFGAMTIGHEAEVADAMKAVGQGMKEKATDELVWLQPHDLLGAVLAVILPSEGDVIVIEGDEAAVGDGDAMSVAAEIGENLSGSAEWLLGVDDPVDAAHGLDKGGEGVAIGETRQLVEESQDRRTRKPPAGVRETGGGTVGRAV